MQILHNVHLADFSTMRLGGIAAHLANIQTRDDLSEALAWASTQNLPVIMIGGGSNIVWRDEGFTGLVLVNKITGYDILNDDNQHVTLCIGAGENWDTVVARTVKAGLTGIESLSLIPGAAGATPVQNVGAYGQEISQTLVSLEAFDTAANDFVTIAAEDCIFGYRASRFKGVDRGRFFITSITLQLQYGNPEPPFYPALQKYLDEHHLAETTPAVVRQAVIAIRTSKLPDPAIVANNGSFFANPIINQEQLEHIERAVGDVTVPHWLTHGGLVKISAAWLVEQAGFKDFHDPETGMATWAWQPLVLVNEAAKHTSDLLTFKQKIVGAVQAKFGVTLVQEPELLPQ
jgi:UDP-N-acetylmuramate dehydrogenase